MELKIKKRDDSIITPTYGTAGAACFDIYSIEDKIITAENSETFNTGLSFEIPDDFVMLVFSRSGHGFKQGIRLANCVGVIDADYRGELGIKLTNDNQRGVGPEKDFTVRRGDRIAQAMLIPVEQVSFLVVDEISDTVRGAGGLGSSGR
jgi:dUTP pyrophosphatase